MPKNKETSFEQDVNDIFSDDTTIPQSNWFKFEKVGDSVQGELVEVFEQEGKFGGQHVYVVRLADGSEINVALKDTTHRIQIQQLKSAENGDVVGFKFREEVDTGKVNPAKSIEVRIRHIAKE